MTERRIQALALGTYYKPRAPTPGPDAGPMRGLVWWAKANRPSLDTVFQLHHQRHPRPPVRIGSPREAYDFFGDVVKHNFDRIRARMGIDEQVVLVPLPSSVTTPSTLDTARWPARRLAEALEARGIGRVRLALAHKAEVPEKHGPAGQDRKARDIARELVKVQEVDPWDRVVLVDDLITWGSTVAAADYVLQPWPEAVALAVGFTDSRPRPAQELRRRVVVYDTETLAARVDDVDPVPD